MRFARFVVLCAMAVVFLCLGHAEAGPADPAARGLDVFLHVPNEAAPGTRLAVIAQAFGFPVVTRAVPLSNATIEIGWDPESLADKVAPPTLTTTTDADGRARLALDVPFGLPGDLEVLVSVRHGGHSRTRAVKVRRMPAAHVEIHTADTRVVPTSTVSAWVRLTGVSDEPLRNTGVTVSLLEAGVARHKERLVTDAGGLVMARVPIPRIDEPVWSWTLEAECDIPGTPKGAIVLQPREEHPGTPKLEAAWMTPAAGARPGDKVPFVVRVRDATGQPIVDHPVVYWVGVKGVTPPKTDEEWTKVGTTARTDGAGEISGVRDAPTLVKASGTNLVLVAKTKAEGHLLTQTRTADVGVATASATLTPEVPALVPGLTHRLFLHVVDGNSEGVAGRFAVTGDGLAASVTTDANGEAELAWTAPEGIGATRNAGACAGGVAAAVSIKPTQPIAALKAQQDGFALCVPVDRDAAGIVHVVPNVARPGETVHLELARAPKAKAKTVSAVVRARHHGHAVSTWLEGSATSADVVIPASAAPGPWDVSIATAEGLAASRIVGAQLLVVPQKLPALSVRRVGGRATPGGSIDVEVKLDDGHGGGLPGAVSAIVVDAFGGGNANVGGLDTRARLCSAIGTYDRCDEVLERAPSTDALRRSLLGHGSRAVLAPANDPGAHATDDLRKAFQTVLKSLEGAVFEAAKSPQTLIDVRRKENGRWVLNPELLTLVTDAMNEPPQTPGGEPLTLPDLVAVDPQVSFDVVARRVARLKLFRVLMAVRQVRTQGGLDPNEPVFKDPNALLRRMVRSGALPEDVLLDPWGGTIQFIPGNGPIQPFLSVVRGFELRAPGPDGKVGTGDDVKDPFERVVRTGTPYAVAVEEDRLVDAKFDMVISDETVKAWAALFEELTGTHLGDGGLGISGIGEGGGGRGEGIGLGSVGTVGHGTGYGRGSSGIANGNAWWSPPVRTGPDGVVRMNIPLGDAETTWRVAFIGAPDGLGTASATLDVASDLPLSLKVIGGAKWTEGDVADVRVLVRNRTDAPRKATVLAAADQAASLESNTAHDVEIPAKGARTITLRVRAKGRGEGRLVLTARSEGIPDDVLRHAWTIAPAGERRVLTRTRFVDAHQTLAVALDHGYSLDAAPRVVLERGYDEAIEAALDSLSPEQAASALAHVDAVETALRVERWATTKSGARHVAIAKTAADIARRAEGRYEAYAALDGENAKHGWLLRQRVRGLVKRPLPKDPKKKKEEEGPVCPEPIDGVDLLDIEPAPSPDLPPCWGARIADTTNALMTSSSPVALSRAILALAERPHRATVAGRLANALRAAVVLRPDGEIDAALETRADRAIVYAALLRASKLGTSTTPEAALFAKLAPLRDVNGGYGSSSATLAVVRALLASQLEGHGTSRVRVVARGFDKRVDVPASGRVVLPLPAGVIETEVRVEGPGVVARFERPVLRSWSQPPPPQSSPVHIEVVWPATARAEAVEPLRLLVRASESREVDVRIPLPPGVTLAAPTKGVSQMQGVLVVRPQVSGTEDVVEIPMRFGLAGTFSVPEASARYTRSPTPAAVAPFRRLVITPVEDPARSTTGLAATPPISVHDGNAAVGRTPR